MLNVSRVNADMFLVKFSGEDGCDEVLQDGPFTFDNHPIVLKKWHPKMKLDITICALLIWIQLPHLPWEFWTMDMLSKIGSICGKPLYCDKYTVSKLKLGLESLWRWIRLENS